MRIFLFSLLFLTCSSAGFSQSFYRVEKAVSTVEIAGKTFAGGYSRTGSVFIVLTSKKSGKEYRRYLGTPTKHVFEGQKVYTNKDEYFIFEINSNGTPSKIKLNKDS